MSMNLPNITQMKNMIRFGLATLGIGAIFVAAALPGKAETPDIFTKHGLPIPGAYFKNQEGQKPATVAVNKSGRGVGEQKSQPRKKNASRSAN
jgi:hypothetical protein